MIRETLRSLAFRVLCCLLQSPPTLHRKLRYVYLLKPVAKGLRHLVFLRPYSHQYRALHPS